MPRICIPAFGVLLTAVTALAEEPLSLAVLIAEALEHNPEILRASQTWEAAKTKPPQENALPDPMLQVGFERNPVLVREFIGGHQLTEPGMLERMNMLSIGLAQEFPYPGKRRLRGQIAEKNAAGAGAELRAVQRSLEAQLKLAYYDLAYSYQALEVVNSTHRVLADFEATTRARYRVGKGTQQEVLKAQVELSVLIQRRLVFENEREAASTQLNGLLNRPPEASLGRPDTLPPPRPLPSLETLFSLARDHNPLLQRRQREVEAAQLQVALMKKEYRPDFNLSAGWKTDGSLDDYFQVMVETQLPLQRQRRQYGVQEALAQLEAARQTRSAAEQLLLALVRTLSSQATASSRLVELYTSALIPQARFALEAALAGYRVGKVELLMLLDNARALLEDELMTQDQLATHHRALAQLEEAVGASLEP